MFTTSTSDMLYLQAFLLISVLGLSLCSAWFSRPPLLPNDILTRRNLFCQTNQVQILVRVDSVPRNAHHHHSAVKGMTKCTIQSLRSAFSVSDRAARSSSAILRRVLFTKLNLQELAFLGNFGYYCLDDCRNTDKRYDPFSV